MGSSPQKGDGLCLSLRGVGEEAADGRGNGQEPARVMSELACVVS